MLEGMLIKPGAKGGPCTEKCEHKYCADIRKIAESTCAVCHKTIGYETRFYEFNAGELGFYLTPLYGPGYAHTGCCENME